LSEASRYSAQRGGHCGRRLARLCARSTQKRHIGFIVTGDLFPHHWFDEAMLRLGWVEGRNLVVERRVTGEDPERRKSAAVELIAAHPDVIVAARIIDAQPVHALTHTGRSA